MRDGGGHNGDRGGELVPTKHRADRRPHGVPRVTERQDRVNGVDGEGADSARPAAIARRLPQVDAAERAADAHAIEARHAGEDGRKAVKINDTRRRSRAGRMADREAAAADRQRAGRRAADKRCIV